MLYIIPGQDDITLAVGAVGDKTTTVTISGTHVIILNEDPQQGVLFSLAPVPVFPADWAKVDPGEEVVVPTGGSISLFLRKKTFVRGLYAPHDVPINIQVGETNQAI